MAFHVRWKGEITSNVLVCLQRTIMERSAYSSTLPQDQDLVCSHINPVLRGQGLRTRLGYVGLSCFALFWWSQLLPSGEFWFRLALFIVATCSYLFFFAVLSVILEQNGRYQRSKAVNTNHGSHRRRIIFLNQLREQRKNR